MKLYIFSTYFFFFFSVTTRKTEKKKDENTFPSVLRCGLNPTATDVVRTQAGGTNSETD